MFLCGKKCMKLFKLNLHYGFIFLSIKNLSQFGEAIFFRISKRTQIDQKEIRY